MDKGDESSHKSLDDELCLTAMLFSIDEKDLVSETGMDKENNDTKNADIVQVDDQDIRGLSSPSILFFERIIYRQRGHDVGRKNL